MNAGSSGRSPAPQADLTARGRADEPACGELERVACFQRLRREAENQDETSRDETGCQGDLVRATHQAEHF